MLTFSVSKKMKINDYFNNLSNINGINLPIFSYDGNFLKKNGLKEGTIIGRTLKIIESEWIKIPFYRTEFDNFGSEALLFWNHLLSLSFLFKATRNTKHTPAAHK